ncbi:ribonucleotide reductase subunit alpha [Brevundimonas sp.]|uniref:ribonucleotide reductase subunit alpha n=1 Tax=Brevundimonas sp. TaxID=1871086 RepID=UPI002FCAA911
MPYPPPMTDNSHFRQLLAAAAAQPEPQRLLFVFAFAELPDRATPEQQERFRSGRGGALAPLMCVDKAPRDIPDFQALVSESERAGPPWSVVFAASLSGQAGRPPDKARIDLALETMVEAVRDGRIAGFAAYGPRGEFLEVG